MRVFRAGELQQAILGVLSEEAPANGYSIMHSLAERLGGRWQPSPGAIYPALLGLEDAGLVRARDAGGTKLYELSTPGRAAAASAGGVLDDVAERVRTAEEPAPSLGEVLDRFAAEVPGRRCRLEGDDLDKVNDLLEELGKVLRQVTTERSD